VCPLPAVASCGRSNSVVDELEDLGYTNLATLARGINRIPPGEPWARHTRGTKREFLTAPSPQ